MKVIHIITGLATGGAETALYNLLNGMANRNVDNHVISLIDQGTIGPLISGLGVPVTALGMSNGRPSISSIKRLYKVIKELQPDIIQGWMYHGNLAATLAYQFTSRQAILAWNIRQTLYDLNYEKKMTRMVIHLNRKYSKLPSVLLYNSILSRRQHENLGFSPFNGRVIPNGIDVQKYSKSLDARNRVRKNLNIPEDAIVVGHVARFHPMKDHQTFLRAAMRLVGRFDNVHFLLCGRGITLDNPHVSQLIPSQLTNRFSFLGEHGNITEIMNAMDIFCLSSAWGEGFPNVIGEAMAAGVPCVATDVGDSADIIGETGVVVQPRDQNALENGIERLLIMPLEERSQLGEKACERIKSNYRLDAVVAQYADLYKSLITEKRAY